MGPLKILAENSYSHIFTSRVFGKSHKMTTFSFLPPPSLFSVLFLVSPCLPYPPFCFCIIIFSLLHIYSHFHIKNIQHKTNSHFISLFNLLTRRRKCLFAFDCELGRLQLGANRHPSFILRKHLCKVKEGEILHIPWIVEARKKRERGRQRQRDRLWEKCRALACTVPSFHSF